MTHYKIGRCIGKGSYGNVFVVKKYGEQKVYAMKKISIYNIRLKEKLQLINEIRILKYCDCPYILNLIDIKYSLIHIDIITNHAKYGDFLSIIKSRSRTRMFFQEQLIWSYFIQVCYGLEYLHNNNIIHRDIKCGNIFLDKGDHIFIGDFGSCKVLMHNNTLTNSSIGTPYYMSPEILKHEKYDNSVDIWCLGCFLFEIICFKPPFEGCTYRLLTRKILNQQFSIDINTYIHHFSKELIKLVQRILKEYKQISVTKILELKEVDDNKYLIPYITKSSNNILDFEKKFNNVSMSSWHSIIQKLTN